MSTKHTPGPWDIKFRNDHSAYISMGNPSGEHKQFDIEFDDRYPSDVADARLMGSAPELLAALQASEKALSEALTLLMNSGLVVVDTGEGELMDVESAVGRIDAAIDSARAAIQKAEGQS